MSLTPPHQKEDRVGSRMLEGKTDHMGGVGIQGRAHEHVLPSRQPSSPFSPKSSLVVRADGLHTPRVEHRRPADRQRGLLGVPGRWQDHRHQWHPWACAEKFGDMPAQGELVEVALSSRTRFGCFDQPSAEWQLCVSGGHALLSAPLLRVGHETGSWLHLRTEKGAQGALTWASN